jgi:NAD(P)-dependent dehydrogenase (short-subunit alcohol dehydrogenase family)
MADVKGERVAAECARLARRDVESHALDVRDSSAVHSLVQDVIGRHGRLDLMFNNAGIYQGGETDELLPAHWDRVIDVNLRGVVNGVNAAYPIMIKQRFGHIVNTASLAGLLPTALVAPYVTTKHAVVGLSLCLRAEAAAHGVGVTVICPGFIDTPFFDHGLPDDLPRSRVYKARQTKQQAEKSRLAEFVLRHSNVYSPERLADDILQGVARNKPLVVRPTSAHLQWLAVRLAPRAVDRIQTRIVRSMLKSLPAEPT